MVSANQSQNKEKCRKAPVKGLEASKPHHQGDLWSSSVLTSFLHWFSFFTSAMA